MIRRFIKPLAFLTGSAVLMAVVIGLAVLWVNAGPNWTDMLALVRHRFPQVKQLSTADLAAWLSDPARPQPQLLDVRGQEEFDVSHLAGAVRVSPDAMAKDILPALEATRPVVVYCSVGFRSSLLAARLLEAGRSDVYNLEGSIFTWANEGRTLEAAGGKCTGLVHPFDSTYGRLLKPGHRAP